MIRRKIYLRKCIGGTYRKYNRQSALMAILPYVWNIQTMNGRAVRHGMAKLCKASGCILRIRIGFTRKVRTCRLGKLVFGQSAGEGMENVVRDPDKDRL